MADTILAMTAGGFGVAVVTAPDGKLLGLVSDGDLRRNMADLMARKAGDVCTRNPVTVTPDTLATEALAILNRNKIGVLIVCKGPVPVGILHVHDLLRIGVM